MLRRRFFHRRIILVLFPVSVGSYFLDYDIFENFNLTKNLFIKEQKLVKELKEIRAYLYQRRNSTTQSIYDSAKNMNIEGTHVQLQNSISLNYSRFKPTNVLGITVFQKPANFSSFTPRTQNNTKYTENIQYLDLSDNVSSKGILRGALHGVLMIYETYDLDIRQFSKGIFRFRNGIENNSRQCDSLHVDDLAMMSTVAMEANWYNTSIECLRESISLYGQFLDKKAKYHLPPDLIKILLSKKKSYSNCHNKMLIEKQKVLGPDWILFPYIVDEGVFLKLHIKKYVLK